MSLIKEIESSNVNENQLIVYFIGQSGYVVKIKDFIIYIDPYLTDYIENSAGLNEKHMRRNYPSPIDPELIIKCDAIICTHAHVDHMDPWTLSQIKTDFQLYTSIGAFEKSDVKISRSRLTFLYPGTTYNLESFKLTPYPAAHYELADEKGRPDCLSIHIQWQDKSLFFWGDGIGYEKQYDLLSPVKFDYFFAPINGRDAKREKMGIIGNIKEYELAEFCSKLSINHIIPNHYDMFKNNTGSAPLFQKEVKRRCKGQSILILNCGDKVEA